MKSETTWDNVRVTVEILSEDGDCDLECLYAQIKDTVRGLGYGDSTVNEMFGEDEEKEVCECCREEENKEFIDLK